MASINSKRTLRRDLWLAGGLLGLGALVAIISLTEIKANHLDQVAQATPEPSATPAESKPGGTRPTTPAPEPARPDPAAQQEGAKPALPPAPAEKVAPPMEKK
ncbi:hypothetical protein ACQR09_22060 [Bradyrhizobium oligotrophicum]|uniref:hypothetical protein n=1 Tax=Bradyrhizobium TaxID=374 RepID=UPI0028EC4D73|nr:hypothetical protein [Bradyrhizobium sp. SZCCHNS3002]